MKKILSCLLIVIYVLCFTGCTKKEEEEKPKVNAFEIKTAANVVENYMSFIMNEDYENGKKLYSKELLQTVDKHKMLNIPILNWDIFL